MRADIGGIVAKSGRLELPIAISGALLFSHIGGCSVLQARFNYTNSS
jgi:hypothetical protein